MNIEIVSNNDDFFQIKTSPNCLVLIATDGLGCTSIGKTEEEAIQGVKDIQPPPPPTRRELG